MKFPNIYIEKFNTLYPSVYVSTGENHSHTIAGLVDRRVKLLEYFVSKSQGGKLIASGSNAMAPRTLKSICNLIPTPGDSLNTPIKMSAQHLSIFLQVNAAAIDAVVFKEDEGTASEYADALPKIARGEILNAAFNSKVLHIF